MHLNAIRLAGASMGTVFLHPFWNVTRYQNGIDFLFFIFVSFSLLLIFDIGDGKRNLPPEMRVGFWDRSVLYGSHRCDQHMSLLRRKCDGRMMMKKRERERAGRNHVSGGQLGTKWWIVGKQWKCVTSHHITRSSKWQRWCVTSDEWINNSRYLSVP